MIDKLKIRAILDCEEDVFRDVSIAENSTLMDLHFALKESFGFETSEMASFYYTDKDWNQGEEIPMEDMFDHGVLTMEDVPLHSIFQQKSDKLIYIYDFLNLWTFFVEFIEPLKSEILIPETLFSYGTLPEKAPEKQMISDDDSLEIQNNLDFSLDLDDESLWN